MRQPSQEVQCECTRPTPWPQKLQQRQHFQARGIMHDPGTAPDPPFLGFVFSPFTVSFAGIGIVTQAGGPRVCMESNQE